MGESVLEKANSIRISKLPARKKYRSYLLHNFRDIPQMKRLGEELKFDIEVVGNVLPFKANNFVVDELIDWDDIPNDPMFRLTFPQKEMLLPGHYQEIASLLRSGAERQVVREAADRIRLQLNPHPAGQIDHNVPHFHGETLHGMQHKYRETILFFPNQGQTCHAYCTFCFRWPQFVGMSEFKFASREIEKLIAYMREHPEITDVLFTGGDPLIMSARNLASYIDPLLDANLPSLRRIRIGTKALAYWPYRFVSDEDAGAMLALFRKVVQSGRQLAIMAHFNHPAELEPEAVADAIDNIRVHRYLLPAIQREVVWDTEQIERLFDSLMRDYPIGSFLFWLVEKRNTRNYQFYQFVRDYHQRDNSHNIKANVTGQDDIIGILDGQQRLTSLYLGLLGSYAYKEPRKRWDNPQDFPSRRLYLNLLAPSTESRII